MKQNDLPLPFPDPTRDFVSLRDVGVLGQSRVTEVATRMGLIWGCVSNCVYKALPGFSGENRSSGVYWFKSKNLPINSLYAEFAPTRKFRALIGLPLPERGHYQREKGLCLRMGVCMRIAELTGPVAVDAGVDVRLFIERVFPVRCLLSAWSRDRNRLEQIIRTANLKVCFGDMLREHPEPYALDGYRLAKSRKHRVDFVYGVPQIIEASSIMAPVVALARIYYAVQGLVWGNPARLAVLNSPS